MALLRSSERVPTRLVHPDDPAIDRDQSDLAGYETHLDQAERHLVFREGAEPTWFSVRAIVNDDFVDAKARARQGRLDAEHSNDRLVSELIRIALVEIENLYGNGGTLKGTAAIDAIQVLPDTITWLGNVIWALTHGHAGRPGFVREKLLRGAKTELMLKGVLDFLALDEPDEVQQEGFDELVETARALLKLDPDTGETDEPLLDDPKK